MIFRLFLFSMILLISFECRANSLIPELTASVWHTDAGTCQTGTTFLRQRVHTLVKNQPAGLKPDAVCIGITAGRDQAGRWQVPLPPCIPGKEYLFTAWLWRAKMTNGAYPRIRIWGQELILNTLWRARKFQKIHVYFKAPQDCRETYFAFMNHDPDSSFWLTQPQLSQTSPMHKQKTRPTLFSQDFFPISIYDVGTNDFKQAASLGINTIMVHGSGKKLKKQLDQCRQLKLKYILCPPHNPAALTSWIKAVKDDVHNDKISFYVNDEPGITGFPIHKANKIRHLLKETFPAAATCMAVVRPQVCRVYQDAADFFMLDQYPVPSMPMTWLSDSMDRAAQDVGHKRLMAVVQAFGGPQWKNAGWPRQPLLQEMQCLAFLALIHGARGLFFYSFNAIKATPAQQNNVRKVISSLKLLKSWLVTSNDQVPKIKMLSEYKLDPRGRPAIQGCLKQKNGRRLLIIVNTIGTHTRALIEIKTTKPHNIRELFSGKSHCVPAGKIRIKLSPYGVKSFEWSDK